MVGGYSNVDHENAEEAKKLFEEHKSAIGLKAGCSDSDLTVDSVEVQVVAGLNYKYVVSAGDKKYKVVIYRMLDNTSEVTDVVAL